MGAESGRRLGNGAPRGIRTPNSRLLRTVTLPFCPPGHLVGSDGVEPPTLNVPRIYSPVPFRSGNFPFGGPAGIRTQIFTALEAGASADSATGPALAESVSQS